MNAPRAQREAVAAMIRSSEPDCSAAMSALSRSPWTVSASDVEEAPRLSTEEGEPCLGALFHAFGEVPIDILAVFSVPDAHAVAEAVTRPYAARLPVTPETVQDCVGEVSNILCQQLIRRIADRLETSIIVSSPAVMLGTEGSLMASALKEHQGDKDTLLLATVSLSSSELKAECRLALLADSGTLKLAAAGA